jgi:hypothetical protein
LWPNDYKTDEKHPDFKGDIFLDQAMLRRLMNGEPLLKLAVSGWDNASGGKRRISIQANEPFKPKPIQPPMQPSAQSVSMADDDIPF